MKLRFYNFFLILYFFLCICYGKKVLFINILNGINVNYNKKHINKNVSYNDNFSNQALFLNKNVTQQNKTKEINPVKVDETNENILRQYIYTLSHLTIFDTDREKDIPLNISLLLKACLASHNYIKNVEIYTSQVQNKEVCSFIYENSKDFENFFNIHVSKYSEFFNNPKISETLKLYINDKNLYENELEIYNKINKNTTLRKDILQDILFECIRTNKIVQYSLAVNKFNLFSYHTLSKVFMYFKSNDLYYDIFLNNIKKIKYYYGTKNIKEEDKKKIYSIIDNYLYILNYMNEMFENGNIL
ncbi:liver merozoite formation protein, putative [Plasmodium gallinaceum]|uniref:Liver merozoite formation protein, putative n=1 Tax=Plasmodium gallinaceum TaxID=5849 RepID=A0A1J1GMP2_PLAGA|nr:liver merozoite formation protein, putative [Plasmodium gallinaceum]CRG93603.1 liver merozoite formation protein, putative [Plasmodium gallinaceum]